MTWAVVRLFLGNALGWLRKALGAAFRWIGSNPLLAIIIALCAVSGLLWHGGNVARHERDAARVQIAAMTKAEQQAKANQLAANKAFQDRSRIVAGGNQHEHETTLGGNLAAADRYISSHRLRPGSSPGTGNPAAKGDPAQLPADAAAEADLATITQSDVIACTGAATYAQSAFDLGKQMVAAGVAEYAGTSPPDVHSTP